MPSSSPDLAILMRTISPIHRCCHVLQFDVFHYSRSNCQRVRLFKFQLLSDQDRGFDELVSVVGSLPQLDVLEVELSRETPVKMVQFLYRLEHRRNLKILLSGPSDLSLQTWYVDGNAVQRPVTLEEVLNQIAR